MLLVIADAALGGCSPGAVWAKAQVVLGAVEDGYRCGEAALGSLVVEGEERDMPLDPRP